MNKKVIHIIVMVMLLLNMLSANVWAADEINTDVISENNTGDSYIESVSFKDKNSMTNDEISLSFSPEFEPATKEYTLNVPNIRSMYFDTIRINVAATVGEADTSKDIYAKYVYDDGTECEEIILTAGTDSEVPGAFSNDRKASKIIIAVKNVSDNTVVDTYTFNVQYKAYLDNLTIKNETGNSISLNETFSPYSMNYSIDVPETTESVAITASGQGNQTVTMNGNKGESTQTVTIDWKGQSSITIPIIVEVDGMESTEYTLTVNNTGIDYTPTFKTKLSAQKATYTQFDEVTPLKPDIEIVGNGTLSYKWYTGKMPAFKITKMSKVIATTENYTPSSQNAGRSYYRCVVAYSVEGKTYEIQSDAVEINITALIAATPTISEQNTENAEYVQGEEADLLKVKATVTDSGKLSYQWYKSESADGEGTVIDGATNDWYKPSTAVQGTSYYYCEVINTIQSVTAKVKSNVISVKVSSIQDIFISGAGTAESPFIISSLEDLSKLRDVVNNGNSVYGIYFKISDTTEKITLPVDWVPIGTLRSGTSSAENGINIWPFAGVLDGNGKTIEVAEGGLPLFGYVREATIKNLNIYGAKINGYGLINNYETDYGNDGNYNTGVPYTAIIEHVVLKNGTQTLRAGFIGGDASGANTITIRNCTVEENVTIGYDKSKSQIGSFAGSFSGEIINSKSYATVYGYRNVGGLVGVKSQSMGPCNVINSSFEGTIVATENNVGGIIGSGYSGGGSAPNTPVVTVQNCFVKADIKGNNNVGGILGTEPGCENCWSNGAGTVSNNSFYGTITALEKNANVGAIIGFLKSFNKYQGITDNYYLDTCNVDSGIGKIEDIITTSHAKYAAFGINYDFNESDYCIKKTAGEYSGNDVVQLLNAGENSYKNWIIDENKGYPVISDTPVLYKITLSGDYKTQYYIGEGFSNVGMVITGEKSDGSSVDLTNSANIKFKGFNSSSRGTQTIKVIYSGEDGYAETSYDITVVYQQPQAITVSFRLYGDSRHDSDADGKVHTLRSGNLESWLYVPSVEIDQNTTVWDVIQRVLKANNMTCSNPSGNYIESITRNGVTLAEFDNGNLSGWMYTLNGSHPSLGVSEQYLNNGDRIVFHYTDDYTKEEGSEDWGNVPYVPEETLPEDAPTVTVTDEAGAAATEGGKVTYDSESKTLTITANDGYEIKDVKVNGVSKGAVTSLTGLTKDDKVEVIFAKSAVTELTAEDLDALLADLTPVARSVKTPNKNVKVTVNLDETDKAIIDRIEDTGYTVKYNFYRSTKKSSKYKSMLIKSGKSYTNTKGKKDRMYFYKARVQVYDADGKLIARTALKQCKYANRKWTKK